MDQIDYPAAKDWEQRRTWFENLFDVDKYDGGYIVSEHALGLLVDLQAVYCSGAFISCVVISCAIIDAHIKEVEGGQGGMQSTFEISSYSEDLEWLRNRRNCLVHLKESDIPTISVDEHYTNRVSHEEEAKRSISLVAKVVFENPCI